MSYQLINKELGIYSCSIEDATGEWYGIYTDTWYEGFKLNDLKIYYNPKTDRITLIKDSKLFESYKKITESYLELNYADRENCYKESNTESIKGLFRVLDAALKHREKQKKEEQLNIKLKEIKGLLGKQYDTPYCLFEEITSIYDDRPEGSKSLSLIDVYNYGFIQGKRAERAKKKQHCEVDKHVSREKQNV